MRHFRRDMFKALYMLLYCLSFPAAMTVKAHVDAELLAD